MVTMDDALPDHPRLRSGCCVFEDPEGLIVRSVGGTYRIDPIHREAMQRILARLDGRNGFVDLLGGERMEDAFYALRMLDWFAQSGLLAEGPIGPEALPRPGLGTPPVSLDGIRLVALNSGLFSGALGRSLVAFGANVRPGDLALARALGAIALVCLDKPDLASLRAMNAAAREAGAAWLPVFPFGDGIITGPSIQPPASPCFRCFELRWLGMSPSVASERAYFAHLQGGALRDGAVVTESDAARLAALVAPIVAGMLSTSARRVAVTRSELGTSSEAPLEPHPRCDACAGPIAPGVEPPQALTEALWFQSPLTLAELAPHVAELAGEPCGLAWIAPPPRNATTDPPALLEIAVARFAFPEPDKVGGKQHNWCHGAAAVAEDARTLAIIEALERYSGLSPPPPGIVASYASIASDALLPTELPLFSDTQYARPGFPFQPFDPERSVRWVGGYNLTRKRPVLVPASAAWYGHDDALLGDCSNGVAAHSSRGYALLNGVLELVERDAFMIHWLNRLSPPRIDLDSTGDDRSRAIVRRIEEGGYAVHLLDLTTDLEIPVALALAVREDRCKPALIVGAGAALDLGTALSRALSELYSATFSPSELWTLKPPLAPADVRRLADHSRAYEHPDWLPHASFLWASPRHTSRSPARPQLDRAWLDCLTTLIARLEAHGHDTIGVDITARDLSRLPLFVIRAIVPGLQPLALETGGRFGGWRLYEAPVRMGYRNTPPREEELNPMPHCFP